MGGKTPGLVSMGTNNYMSRKSLQIKTGGNLEDIQVAD